MSQIPDQAAERVLGVIREIIDLDTQGRQEDAEALLKPLIAEFPEASLLHSYMAWVQSRNGKHREAIEHGRAAVKLLPESELASIMLFRAFWNAGEHRQAFDEMKRLEQYGPSQEYARMMQEWNEGNEGNPASKRIQ